MRVLLKGMAVVGSRESDKTRPVAVVAPYDMTVLSRSTIVVELAICLRFCVCVFVLL